MRTRTGLAAAALMLLAVPQPSGAAHTYTGVASATGLELTVTPPEGEPQGLTIGFTQSAVQSGPTEEGCEGDAVACASAAAALEPFGTTVTATSPGDEGPKASTAFTLPEGLAPLLLADVAGATAGARHVPGDSAGRADAGVSTIDVTVTQTLVESVPPIQDALDAVNENLGPIFEQDPTGTIGPILSGALDQIATNLGSGPVARVSAGPSSSNVTDLEGRTSATARANGAVVTLLPPPDDALAVAPLGLVTIEVGAASATATTDQTTATGSFDPAIVRVRVFDPSQESMYREVAVATGQERTCVGTAPLVACIGAGSGTTTAQGAAASAAAQGVTVELLAAPLPTVRLQLAAATAGVNAAPPAPSPSPTPPPVVGSETLPRTGGSLAVPTLAILTAAAGTGALARRRRGR